MASYFTRGSGHDADARYSEDETDYKYILDRLRKKFETARKFVPKPIVEKERGVKTGIICYGSSYEPVREARDRLNSLVDRLDERAADIIRSRYGLVDAPMSRLAVNTGGTTAWSVFDAHGNFAKEAGTFAGQQQRMNGTRASRVGPQSGHRDGGRAETGIAARRLHPVRHRYVRSAASRPVSHHHARGR